MQNSLLEQTNINETLSARLQKFTQLYYEKAELAALKAAVSARKCTIRQLTETVEQYGEMSDLLSGMALFYIAIRTYPCLRVALVEPGSETLLIERSWQTPTDAESCTPEQQPCKKRKMNYLQDE